MPVIGVCPLLPQPLASDSHHVPVIPVWPAVAVVPHCQVLPCVGSYITGRVEEGNVAENRKEELDIYINTCYLFMYYIYY